MVGINEALFLKQLQTTVSSASYHGFNPSGFLFLSNLPFN
jgi:hypothetical protein